MVKKLLKHELYCIFRAAFIPAIVMVLLAILSRISLTVSGENTAAFMLVLFYVYTVLATLCVCFFFGISRFYKSLFTGEGYMTLSLPVTADQLIVSKLLSSVITMVFGIAACVLSSCIFLIGLPEEFYVEIGNVIGSMGGLISDIWVSEPLLVVEYVIYTILSIPAGFLEFYFVMSIAQLFTVKNRKLIAVLLYIGIAFVWSMLDTTLISPMLDNLSTNVSPHLTIWLEIIFTAAIDVVSYLVVRYILKNKVNLIA
ncbi:MAG: hypothetical protein ACI4L9_00685 [Candidatus Coproplasma sp.]